MENDMRNQIKNQCFIIIKTNNSKFYCIKSPTELYSDEYDKEKYSGLFIKDDEIKDGESLYYLYNIKYAEDINGNISVFGINKTNRIYDFFNGIQIIEA